MNISSYHVIFRHYFYHLIYLIYFLKDTSIFNDDVCEDKKYNENILHGVIRSPNYPILKPFQKCSRKIHVTSGRVIKIYVADLELGEKDSDGVYESYNFYFLSLICKKI